MPLLTLRTSVPVAEDAIDELMLELSAAVAQALGKPERYVMVTLDSGPAAMAGSLAPSALATISSIGALGSGPNGRVAARICAILKERLELPGERVYVTFTDVPASHWASDGATFG